MTIIFGRLIFFCIFVHKCNFLSVTYTQSLNYMKYYIAKNGQQLGPMEPFEAANIGITPDTLVWAEGMPDWAPARNIAEFAPYLNQQPPVMPGSGYNATYNAQPGQQAYAGQQGGMMPPCPSSHLVMAILVTLFCCLPFGIVSIVYASKVEGCYNSGNFILAQQNSDKAKKWSIIGIVSSVIFYVIYILLYAVGVVAFMGMQ